MFLEIFPAYFQSYSHIFWYSLQQFSGTKVFISYLLLLSKLQSTQWFKTMHIYYLSFYALEVCDLLIWVLWVRPHKATTKMSAGMYSHLKAQMVKNPLVNTLMLLAELIYLSLGLKYQLLDKCWLEIYLSSYRLLSDPCANGSSKVTAYLLRHLGREVFQILFDKNMKFYII